MKQQAVIADTVLAPGEPQQRDVHPENAAVMAEELARRAEMLRAKLTKRQHKRVTAEYRQLHKKLNRARYNKLVQRHTELKQRYAYELAAYRENPTRKGKALIFAIRRDGKALEKRIAALASTVARFEALSARLDAHNRVLAMEKEDRENQKAFFREAGVWENQIKAVFYQSKRLHHVTTDSKGNPLTIVPQIDHIVLKSDKVYFRLRIVQQGLIERFTGMWRSALPYGVDVSDLVSDETIANLTAACGRVVTVERGQRSQNIFYVISRLDSADGIPQAVRLDQLIDYYPQERHKFTPWLAGLGENRVVKYFDHEQHPHMLIAGSSGGGKSNLINAILCQFITLNSPDELRLVLIDNKGGVELSHFDNVPHLLIPTVIDAGDVLPTLRQLRQIMQSRYAMMHSIGVKNLVAYNSKVTIGLPRIVVVIDEMATLLAIPETSDIHNELRVISSQGRAAGIHLIVSTQHPSVDVLPGWIKTNLTLRIASKMPNHTASQIVVDSITAAHLPEVPGRMVFRRGGFEEKIQTPLVDDPSIARYVKEACEYPAPEWQLTAKTDADDVAAGIVSASEPAPRRRFGVEEYIRAALTLGGSLSYRKVYEDSDASEYLSRTDCEKLQRTVIDYLLDQDEICIDAVRYKIQRAGRGYSLAVIPDELPSESPENEIPEMQEYTDNTELEENYEAG